MSSVVIYIKEIQCSLIPLTSHTGLEIEEANFTITAVPSGHVIEAVTTSCLRVAFVRVPRGSGRIAAAR